MYTIPTRRVRNDDGRLVKTEKHPFDIFKPIPDCPHLCINLRGYLWNLDTKEKRKYEDEKIGLTLYGNKMMYSFDWVKLLAYYEVELPTQFQHRLLDISFIDIQKQPTESITLKTMAFAHPFTLESGHRIIPNYTRYAIDKNGNVLDLQTNKCVPIQYPKDKSYPRVATYCPERNKYASTLLHRLLGYAWIPNTDWFVNNTINHKDGKKHNFALYNLEWVSQSFNSAHAHAHGLKGEIIVYVSRDVESGEVKEHYSVRDLRKYVGHSNLDKNIIQSLKPGRLINGKYEVRIKGDNQRWFWIDRTPTKIGRYYIQVKDIHSKVVNKFTTVNQLIEAYPLSKPSNESWSIEVTVKKFRSNYKGLYITYTDNFIQGPYHALNIHTGEIITREYTRDIGAAIGCSKTTILRVLNSDEPYLINNTYIVCTDACKDILSKDYSHLIEQRFDYKVTKGDEVFEFDSLRKVGNFLHIGRKMVKRLIEEKCVHKGYKIDREPCTEMCRK